jgi:hypothetical protein
VSTTHVTSVKATSSTFILVCAMVLGLLVGGCADKRPDALDWEQGWRDATAMVPEQAALGSPPATELCARSLGSLRSVFGDLIPTPYLALDATVRTWLDIAQDAMFECPPSSADLPDMDAAYEELSRLEAEVASVLAENRGG